MTDGARTRDNQIHKLALYQLNYGHHLEMACLKRFELLTHALEGRCSIQLSYRHILNILNFGAGDEGRTRDIQLGRLTLYQLSYSRRWSE